MKKLLSFVMMIALLVPSFYVEGFAASKVTFGSFKEVQGCQYWYDTKSKWGTFVEVTDKQVTWWSRKMNTLTFEKWSDNPINGKMKMASSKKEISFVYNLEGSEDMKFNVEYFKSTDGSLNVLSYDPKSKNKNSANKVKLFKSFKDMENFAKTTESWKSNYAADQKYLKAEQDAKEAKEKSYSMDVSDSNPLDGYYYSAKNSVPKLSLYFDNSADHRNVQIYGENEKDSMKVTLTNLTITNSSNTDGTVTTVYTGTMLHQTADGKETTTKEAVLTVVSKTKSEILLVTLTPDPERSIRVFLDFVTATAKRS